MNRSKRSDQARSRTIHYWEDRVDLYRLDGLLQRISIAAPQLWAKLFVLTQGSQTRLDGLCSGRCSAAGCACILRTVLYREAPANHFMQRGAATLARPAPSKTRAHPSVTAASFCSWFRVRCVVCDLRGFVHCGTCNEISNDPGSYRSTGRSRQ